MSSTSTPALIPEALEPRLVTDPPPKPMPPLWIGVAQFGDDWWKVYGPYPTEAAAISNVRCLSRVWTNRRVYRLGATP